MMSELNDIPSALQAPLPATLARWTCIGWAKKARLMTIIVKSYFHWKIPR